VEAVWPTREAGQTAVVPEAEGEDLFAQISRVGPLDSTPLGLTIDGAQPTVKQLPANARSVWEDSEVSELSK
jgi:hypothetical protein